MPYKRDQPVASDDLSVSQPILLGNTNSADDTFAIDHYGFSDRSGNAGLHREVETVVQGSLPVTVTNPIFVGYQPSANVGAIQYSLGPNGVVGSPVTKKQSQATAITLASLATTNVLDFTGLTRAICILYAVDYETVSLTDTPVLIAMAVWNGATLKINSIYTTGGGILAPLATGNILQIRNSSASTMNQIFWTLEYQRIQ